MNQRSVAPGQVWFVDFDPVRAVERLGWMHRVQVSSGGGWVITEQIRTVAADRFRRHAPEITLSEDELEPITSSATDYSYPNDLLSFRGFAAQLWGRCQHALAVLG